MICPKALFGGGKGGGESEEDEEGGEGGSGDDDEGEGGKIRGTDIFQIEDFEDKLSISDMRGRGVHAPHDWQPSLEFFVLRHKR